jgi:hypothetical protein
MAIASAALMPRFITASFRPPDQPISFSLGMQWLEEEGGEGAGVDAGRLMTKRSPTDRLTVSNIWDLGCFGVFLFW